MKFGRDSFFLLFIVSLICLPISSLAMLPVVDAGAIANLIKNYEQLKSQYDVLNRTLNQAKQLKQDAEGHYGYGEFLNGTQDLKNREWSPDNWNSTLQGLSGGNPERYRELVNAYKKNHPNSSQSDYQKGASQEKAKVYSQDVQVNRAAMVNATYSFNNIKTHLTTIHTLSEKIDQSKNTKAAIDLNSRLLAEVAFIQTQELKMLIVLNQQLAQVSADNIAEKTQSAKFNTLPNK